MCTAVLRPDTFCVCRCLGSCASCGSASDRRSAWRASVGNSIVRPSNVFNCLERRSDCSDMLHGPRYGRSSMMSKLRRVGHLGDVRPVLVFDLGISQDRGPAFLGFSWYLRTAAFFCADIYVCSPDKVEVYLVGLHESDPLSSQPTNKFAAWTLRSRHRFCPSSRQDASTTSLSQVQETTTWQQPQTQDHPWEESDPAAQVRETLAVFDAATTSPDAKERVFAQTAAGGANVLRCT